MFRGQTGGGQPHIRREPNGQQPPGSYDSAFVGCPAALLLLPHPPRSGAALPEERRQRRLTGPGWSTPPWGRTVVLWREGSVPSPAPLGKSPCRLPGRPEVNFPIKAVGLVRQTAVLPSAGPGDEAGVGPGTELGRFLGTGVQNLGFPPSGPLSLPRWSSAIPNQRPGDQARKG